MIERARVHPMLMVVAGALFAAISAWSSGRPALELAMLLVAGPIIEEWAYRDVLWRRLPAGGATRVGLSTAVFVGVHWGIAALERVEVPASLAAGWIGTSLLCSIGRLRFGLIAAIFIHMSANGITVMLPDRLF